MASAKAARLIVFATVLTVPAVTAVPGTEAPPDGTVTLRVDGRSNQTPWVAALGNTVAVTWGASADGKTDVFLAMSRDGGRSFDKPRQINAVPGEARLGGELPPRVELRALGQGAPEVVVLWTARASTTEIRISRSVDGGQSFAPPVTLQTAGVAGDRGWPALTLDAHGTAHVVWLDHRGLAAKAATTAHADHQNAAVHDGAAMAERSGLYYAAAGGQSTPERQLTPGVCYCCKTALAAAPDGAIYAVWRHVYPGNLRDIAFMVSRDRGRSFSAPLRVSEDRWQLNGCPDDGPAMAVDASGTVHVIWPTVLQGPEPQGALFYATARDGRTFSSRIRVPTMGSPKPSHPQIAIDPASAVMVAWDEVIDGTRTAFARAVSGAGGNPVAFGDVIRLEPTGSSMYPVVAAAADGRVVAWTAGAPGASVIRVRRL